MKDEFLTNINTSFLNKIKDNLKNVILLVSL